MRQVVVVGASAAGLAAAETLRREGYDGRLTLVGAEPHLPYDRPPLSKMVLTGAWDPVRTRLRPGQHYEGLDVRLRLRTAATGLDLTARTVQLDDGDQLSYDGLIIATGVAPRRLAGVGALAGVHVLRTLDDVAGLRAELGARPTTAVVGGGFLGAEAAAGLRELGLDVTLVDLTDEMLFRQLGPAVGSVVGQLHREHGVRLRLGRRIVRLIGEERVTGIELDDGAVVAADVVLVAIGAVPAVGWLDGCGLMIGDGLECDPWLRAAPGVYAAGDVVSWPSGRFGVRMRVEHRVNATEQAGVAARNLLGAGTRFDSIPFFWSEQFGTRIQAYGHVTGECDVTIARGSAESRRFVAHYRQEGRLTGVLGWNMPAAVRDDRALIASATV